MEVVDLVHMYCGVVLVVLVAVVVVVGVACDDLWIFLLDIAVDDSDVVLRLLVCCTSNVVVVVVAAFLDCGDFWLLYVDLFCFVDCCCVVVILVGVVGVELVLGCVVPVV